MSVAAAAAVVYVRVFVYEPPARNRPAAIFTDQTRRGRHGDRSAEPGRPEPRRRRRERRVLRRAGRGRGLGGGRGVLLVHPLLGAVAAAERAEEAGPVLRRDAGVQRPGGRGGGGQQLRAQRPPLGAGRRHGLLHAAAGRPVLRVAVPPGGDEGVELGDRLRPGDGGERHPVHVHRGDPRQHRQRPRGAGAGGQVPACAAEGVLRRVPEAEAEPGELRGRAQPGPHVHAGPAGAPGRRHDTPQLPQGDPGRRVLHAAVPPGPGLAVRRRDHRGLREGAVHRRGQVDPAQPGGAGALLRGAVPAPPAAPDPAHVPHQRGEERAAGGEERRLPAAGGRGGGVARHPLRKPQVGGRGALGVVHGRLPAPLRPEHGRGHGGRRRLRGRRLPERVRGLLRVRGPLGQPAAHPQPPGRPRHRLHRLARLRGRVHGARLRQDGGALQPQPQHLGAGEQPDHAQALLRPHLHQEHPVQHRRPRQLQPRLQGRERVRARAGQVAQPGVGAQDPAGREGHQRGGPLRLRHGPDAGGHRQRRRPEDGHHALRHRQPPVAGGGVSAAHRQLLPVPDGRGLHQLLPHGVLLPQELHGGAGRGGAADHQRPHLRRDPGEPPAGGDQHRGRGHLLPRRRRVRHRRLEEQRRPGQAVPQGGVPLLCQPQALDAAAAHAAAALPRHRLPRARAVPLPVRLPALPHAAEPGAPARPHAADAAAAPPHAHAAPPAAVADRVLSGVRVVKSPRVSASLIPRLSWPLIVPRLGEAEVFFCTVTVAMTTF